VGVVFAPNLHSLDSQAAGFFNKTNCGLESLLRQLVRTTSRFANTGQRSLFKPLRSVNLILLGLLDEMNVVFAIDDFRVDQIHAGI
jgi:hypothetical protein